MANIQRNKWLIDYAFEKLGMNSIIAAFMEDNLVVKKTVEFLGFKKIGLTPGTGSGCFQTSQDIVTHTSALA